MWDEIIIEIMLREKHGKEQKYWKKSSDSGCSACVLITVKVHFLKVVKCKKHYCKSRLRKR